MRQLLCTWYWYLVRSGVNGEHLRSKEAKVSYSPTTPERAGSPVSSYIPHMQVVARNATQGIVFALTSYYCYCLVCWNYMHCCCTTLHSSGIYIHSFQVMSFSHFPFGGTREGGSTPNVFFLLALQTNPVLLGLERGGKKVAKKTNMVTTSATYTCWVLLIVI